MTYLELYRKANKLLDLNEITIGEYEKLIEPLNQEIPGEERTNNDTGTDR